MKELVNAVQKLYEKSTKIRFLSDANGNIMWKVGKGIDDESNIIFPDGVPYNKDEEKYSTVTINGESYSVSGSVLSTEKKGAILWTVHSISEVLNELGSTDTYNDTCYIISEAKKSVESILLENEKVTATGRRRSTSPHIIKQNNECYSLLRQIESFQELTTVIYKRAVNNSTINIVELMKEVVDESNKHLLPLSISITFTPNCVDVNGAIIKANRYYLFLCLMTIIRKLVLITNIKNHIISVTSGREKYIISFTFEHDMSHYTDSIGSDFSMYCAKMYVKYLGGSFEEQGNNLIITLPAHTVTSFHSKRAEYNYKPELYDRLVKIYLSDIKNEK